MNQGRSCGAMPAGEKARKRPAPSLLSIASARNQCAAVNDPSRILELTSGAGRRELGVFGEVEIVVELGKVALVKVAPQQDCVAVEQGIVVVTRLGEVE